MGPRRSNCGPLLRTPALSPLAHEGSMPLELSQALRVLRDSGWIQRDPLPARDYDYADDRKQRFNPYAV